MVKSLEERFEVERVVGRGSFGVASLCRDRKSGEPCVVKELEQAGLGPKEMHAAMNEARVLWEVAHPHIVRILDALVLGTTLCLVLEYADGGDLASRVEICRAEDSKIPEESVFGWVAQLCDALAYLHDRQILHRDVAPKNVFLSSGSSSVSSQQTSRSRRKTGIEVVKLGDFGTAVLLDAEAQLARTCLGTPNYLSPEIVNGKPYDGRADVWSLGCVIYEVLALRPPFEGHSLGAVVRKIALGRYPSLPKETSPLLAQFVAQMLKRKPTDRPELRHVARDAVAEGKKQRDQAASLAKTRARGKELAKRPVGLIGCCRGGSSLAAEDTGQTPDTASNQCLTGAAPRPTALSPRKSAGGGGGLIGGRRGDRHSTQAGPNGESPRKKAAQAGRSPGAPRRKPKTAPQQSPQPPQPPHRHQQKQQPPPQQQQQTAPAAEERHRTSTGSVQGEKETAGGGVVPQSSAGGGGTTRSSSGKAASGDLCGSHLLPIRARQNMWASGAALASLGPLRDSREAVVPLREGEEEGHNCTVSLLEALLENDSDPSPGGGIAAFASAVRRRSEGAVEPLSNRSAEHLTHGSSVSSSSSAKTLATSALSHPRTSLPGNVVDAASEKTTIRPSGPRGSTSSAPLGGQHRRPTSSTTAAAIAVVPPSDSRRRHTLGGAVRAQDLESEPSEALPEARGSAAVARQELREARSKDLREFIKAQRKAARRQKRSGEKEEVDVLPNVPWGAWVEGGMGR